VPVVGSFATARAGDHAGRAKEMLAMDSHRFDALTRALGHRVSRRTALRQAGIGLAVGFAVPALGRVGSAGASAPAAMAGQPEPAPAPDARIVVAPFDATVRRGPNAGRAYVGMLAIAVEPDGRIDQGRLVLADGTAIPVVGQTNGRAINLAFGLSEDGTLYGAGVAKADASERFGDSMGGPFAGPDPGDVGDWQVSTRVLPTAEGALNAAICNSCREFAALYYGGISPNDPQVYAACRAEGSCDGVIT
jgi:hypothetical protein